MKPEGEYTNPAHRGGGVGVLPVPPPPAHSRFFPVLPKHRATSLHNHTGGKNHRLAQRAHDSGLLHINCVGIVGVLCHPPTALRTLAHAPLRIRVGTHRRLRNVGLASIQSIQLLYIHNNNVCVIYVCRGIVVHMHVSNVYTNNVNNGNNHPRSFFFKYR